MKVSDLYIVLGPTAVGKSDWGVELAESLSCPIINCDSRQIYREMRIGTAVPSDELLSRVRHYMIGTHSVTEPYTAGKYELEANALVESLFREYDSLVMIGGSGFYIDAFCNGLDDFPPADQELRRQLSQRLAVEGVAALRNELKLLDLESYNTIDVANGQRVVRALEVCLMTGRPFSSFKTSPLKKRPFNIHKIGLSRERQALYDRIDRRVLGMVADGLVEEVRSLLPYREYPALKTVGYREIFDYLDGAVTLERAVELIQRNTRHYAKRQMSYWRRDKSIEWRMLE